MDIQLIQISLHRKSLTNVKEFYVARKTFTTDFTNGIKTLQANGPIYDNLFKC